MIDELEADVVAGPWYFDSRIAQADHQFHRRQGDRSRPRGPVSPGRRQQREPPRAGTRRRIVIPSLFPSARA